MGDDEDRYSDSDGSDGSSFEHLDICPLESQCNPSLDGVFDKDAVLERVGAIVGSESRPITDHRSSAEYRRHAVGVLARRLVRRASTHGVAA